jgi:hypothetical protein
MKRKPQTEDPGLKGPPAEGVRPADAPPRRPLARDPGPKPLDELDAAAAVIDLMRLRGITLEYVRLLQACGVHSIEDLRRSSADRLADAMMEVNAARGITDLVPSQDVVQAWIDQASR